MTSPFPPVPAQNPSPLPYSGPILALPIGKRMPYRGKRDISDPVGWSHEDQVILPTFRWDTPGQEMAAQIDSLSNPAYRAVRSFWQIFETGIWQAAEWTRDYRGDDIWRMTDRRRPPSNRSVISRSVMEELETHGLVHSDDQGLRVPTPFSYRLWRAARLAGWFDRADEVLTQPIPVPIGYAAPGIEDLDDLDTCIVTFEDGRGIITPLRIDDQSWGPFFIQQLKEHRIYDPGRSEIAIRLGEWLYPPRNSVYGSNLINRMQRKAGDHYRRVSSQPQIGWDPHFVDLTVLGGWHQHALQRYRTALEARLLPETMPEVRRPEAWWHDPLLAEGTEIRQRNLQARARNRANKQGPVA